MPLVLIRASSSPVETLDEKRHYLIGRLGRTVLETDSFIFNPGFPAVVMLEQKINTFT